MRRRGSAACGLRETRGSCHCGGADHCGAKARPDPRSPAWRRTWRRSLPERIDPTPLTAEEKGRFIAKVRTRFLRLNPLTGEETIAAYILVFLFPDGSIASQPMRHPQAPALTSTRHALLYQHAIRALTASQPFDMLPPEKFQQWRRLVLVFPMVGDITIQE